MQPGWKRTAALFLASQGISLFGSALVQLAITWYITLTTKSGSMMTVAIICGFLPTLLVSPFAGVWADRYDRKFLIIVADSAIALCTLILAILFLLGYEYVWLLFVASAIRALGAGIQMPAVNAFLPQFVPQENLTRVNAINGMIQSTMTLLSPMLSATLLTVASIKAIFFIDVVTAAIGITILVVFLHVPERVGAGEAEEGEEAEEASYFSDLRAGIAYIAERGFLKAFFLFNAVFFTFMGPMEFLTPLQIARRFGDEVWRLSAIEVAFSIGMLVGGLLMAYWGGFANRLYSMALAIFIFGACTVVLGLPPRFTTYVVLTGVAGFVVPLFNTPATVMLQERVDEAYLGRIFGLHTMIASSLMPLSMLVYGPLADVISIERLLVGTGAVLILQGVLMLVNRPLRQAGRPMLASATD